VLLLLLLLPLLSVGIPRPAKQYLHLARGSWPVLRPLQGGQ